MQNDVDHSDTMNPFESLMIVKCSLIPNCKPERGLYPKNATEIRKGSQDYS